MPPLKILLPVGIFGGFLFIGILFFSPQLAGTLVVIAIGISMVWKTNTWLEMFGRNPWAEQYLTSGVGAGAGGSWLFYKLLGIVMIVCAFFWYTGALQAIFLNTVGVFFRGAAE